MGQAIRIAEQQNGDPILAATLQALSGSQDSGGSSTSQVVPQGINNTLNASMEVPFIEFLAVLQGNPYFNNLVSISNEYGQTLAHIAVLFGYYSLLSNLVDWGIDLSLADSSGYTALHLAYLRSDAQSIALLHAAGASGFALDDMGRIPLQLAFCTDADLSENESDSEDDSFSTVSSDRASSVPLEANRSKVTGASPETLEALKSREVYTTTMPLESSLINVLAQGKANPSYHQLNLTSFVLPRYSARTVK